VGKQSDTIGLPQHYNLKEILILIAVQVQCKAMLTNTEHPLFWLKSAI